MNEKKKVIKTRNFPKAEGYHNEHLHSLLQNRKAWSVELTKTINVISGYVNPMTLTILNILILK